MPDILTLEEITKQADSLRTEIAKCLTHNDPRLAALATTAGLASMANALQTLVNTRASQVTADDLLTRVTATQAKANALAASPISGQLLKLARNNTLTVNGAGVLHTFVMGARNGSFSMTVDNVALANNTLPIPGPTVYDYVHWLTGLRFNSSLVITNNSDGFFYIAYTKVA